MNALGQAAEGFKPEMRNPLRQGGNPLDDAAMGRMTPFDPKTDDLARIGIGKPLSEYMATSRDKNGDFVNYPLIWYDEAGQPHQLEREQAMRQAVRYERESGKAFPRFRTFEEALVNANDIAHQEPDTFAAPLEA